MSLIGKKLIVNTDYDYICEVKAFRQATKVGAPDLYEVVIPFVGSIHLQKSQVYLLFKDASTKIKSDSKDSKPKVETPDLKKRRAALKAQKKDALLKTVADMSLEDEIASSLKKDLLVEEILKEEFKESYEAEG